MILWWQKHLASVLTLLCLALKTHQCLLVVLWSVFALITHQNGYTVSSGSDIRFCYKWAGSVGKHGRPQPTKYVRAEAQQENSLTICPIITNLGTYLQALIGKRPTEAFWAQPTRGGINAENAYQNQPDRISQSWVRALTKIWSACRIFAPNSRSLWAIQITLTGDIQLSPGLSPSVLHISNKGRDKWWKWLKCCRFCDDEPARAWSHSLSKQN